MDPKNKKNFDDITEMESEDNILEPLEDHFLDINPKKDDEEVTIHDDSDDDNEPTNIKKINKD